MTRVGLLLAAMAVVFAHGHVEPTWDLAVGLFVGGLSGAWMAEWWRSTRRSIAKVRRKGWIQ